MNHSNYSNWYAPIPTTCLLESEMAELDLGGGPVGMQAMAMEVGGPEQGVQMDLKALLEAHILEHPLESAFHG